MYYFGVVFLHCEFTNVKTMNRKFDLKVNFTLEIEMSDGEIQSSTADVTLIRERFNYIIRRMLETPSLTCGVSSVRMLDNRNKPYRTFIINY